MDQKSRIAIAADDELQLSVTEVQAILADRAVKLASAYTQVVDSSARRLSLISFGCGEHRFAVELKYLTEIRPLDSWTPVPGIPDYYLGVIQLRGEIIAVVDISMLFGGSGRGEAGERFGVVIAAGDSAAALLADTVDDVHEVSLERVHPPLSTFTLHRERYIRGLTDDGLAILDVERLLNDEWLRVSHDQTEERR